MRTNSPATLRSGSNQPVCPWHRFDIEDGSGPFGQGRSLEMMTLVPTRIWALQGHLLESSGRVSYGCEDVVPDEMAVSVEVGLQDRRKQIHAKRRSSDVGRAVQLSD
jgi:hypothetical protein